MIEGYGPRGTLKLLANVPWRTTVPPTNTKPKESPFRKLRGQLESRDAARLAVIGALVLYAVLFVILNSHNVSISFVLFDTHVPVLVALLLAGGIGVGAGWLLADRRAGRKNRFKP
jgi:uncharacterized integral membrane protein